MGTGAQCARTTRTEVSKCAFDCSPRWLLSRFSWSRLLSRGRSRKEPRKVPGPAPRRNIRSLCTAWASPDLQGVWSYANFTPLNGRTNYPAGICLVDEEVAEPSTRKRAQAPIAGTDRRKPTWRARYNAFWYDRGKSDGRTSLIVDPADGRLPSMTPEGRAPPSRRAEQTREHAVRLGSGSAITGALHHLPRRAAAPVRLQQHLPDLPDARATSRSSTRTSTTFAGSRSTDVHTSAANIRQWNGDSRGHWEGDTLVVETTNYSPKTTFNFPVAGETLRAVERFTRVAADRIDYRFTITDPTTYTRPWTAALPLMNLPDYVIYEYACHEGNYAIGTASAARAPRRNRRQKRGDRLFLFPQGSELLRHN